MRARALVLAASAVLWAGCDGGEAPATAPEGGRPLPEGVALELGGRPVRGADLERAAQALALLRPQSTRPDLLRRVVCDHALPREALALRHPEDRDRAEREARSLAEGLRAGTSAAVGVPAQAYPDEVDLFLWSELSRAGAGDVVGPVEGAGGAFYVARVTAPFDPQGPIAQEVGFEGFAFPFVEPPPGGFDVPALLDGLELRLAGPQWRDLLPTGLLHGLRTEVAPAAPGTP